MSELHNMKMENSEVPAEQIKNPELLEAIKFRRLAPKTAEPL